MGLRRATWPSPSKPQYSSLLPPPHRRNPMALSTLLHPTMHISSQYALPTTAMPNLEDRDHELFIKTRDRDWASVDSSDFSSSSSSTTSPPSTPTSTYYYGSQNDVARYSSTVPKTNKCHRPREHRSSDSGTKKNKRHYCTFVHYNTGLRCDRWNQGYKHLYDLTRHLYLDHGPEEVELIDRGELTFDKAQSIRSEQQLIDLKDYMENTICRDCLTDLSRLDALLRHRSTRACAREQERRRRYNITGVTIHKKKGPKTAANHKRR